MNLCAYGLSRFFQENEIEISSTETVYLTAFVTVQVSCTENFNRLFFFADFLFVQNCLVFFLAGCLFSGIYAAVFSFVN